VIFETDREGREVLAGLTFEQTKFCVEQRLKYIKNEHRSADEKSRYTDLMSKHDLYCLIMRTMPDNDALR
jgi:hypothetical protein